MSRKMTRSGGQGVPFTLLAGVGLLATGAPAMGQIAAPSRDELRGVTAPVPEQVPRLSIKGGIERSACPLADPRFNSVMLTVNSVEFLGLKGATAEELSPAWKPFADVPQNVSVLCEIRDAAATILRNKGYIAAVEVPVQKIVDGKVQMQLMFGRITAVRARGEAGGAEAKLLQYLGRLTEDEIFDRNKVERYLLLARDLPGYNVQLTLKPAGTNPGDLIGEVTVTRRPYALDITVQNLAAQATGRWGGQVRGQVFGLTGMGDATSLSYYATADFREQHILQGTHEFRPGREGLTLGGQLTYAWTRPSLATATAPGASLSARTLYASLYARYPLQRSQARNLWLSGGLDIANQDVTFFGPLNRDRLRVAWAKVDFDAIDTSRPAPRWKLGGSLELRQGLDIFSASRNCIGAACPAGAIATSRFDGTPAATVLRGDASAELSLGKVALVLSPRAQYAFKPVMAFEEFSAGTYTIGRGYDPGTLLGDNGLGFSAELRGPHWRIGQSGKTRLQPFVFTDAAWVWDKGTPGAEKLFSAGGGVMADINGRFRVNATLAVPIQRISLTGSRGDVRLLISLTSRILPWRTN